MEADEFLIGLKEVSGALTDLLVVAEENNYLHHDQKAFKLLSKAFVAVELAYAIKCRGDANLYAVATPLPVLKFTLEQGEIR